jgi:DNA repair exonuclease SbcCD ATPase subunit
MSDKFIVDLAKRVDRLEESVKGLQALEKRVKHIEDSLKDLIKIGHLEKTVKEQELKMANYQNAAQKGDAYFRKNFENQARLHANLAKETQAELAALKGDAAKQAARTAKAELLEARLKGLEVMMQSMQQSIDMLERRH